MLEKFIEEWFPKTEQWRNIGKFIVESGIEITEEQNPKWLTGYTNIGKSHKPHHRDEYVRYMEESMFMLHDLLHNIFTINLLCEEEEYIKRQIYGELFVFYLTEFKMPYLSFKNKHLKYIEQRGSYNLLYILLSHKPNNQNVIDYMRDCFIEDSPPINFECDPIYSVIEKDFKKYSKMFKEDLENSRKNYKFVKDLKVEDYCMVGESSQNHIDFFEAISKGAIKNIKRDFNLVLPKNWI